MFAHKSELHKRREKKIDPLFAINVLCAKLRADLAPLAWRSWVTTKSPARLQDLLLIYMAWAKGYDICAHTNRIEQQKKSTGTNRKRKHKNDKPAFDVFGNNRQKTRTVASVGAINADDEENDNSGSSGSNSDYEEGDGVDDSSEQ